MGSTIGHELTHGFDDEGRQFDKDGNLLNWWTKSDEEKFNDRAECMVRQYDAIEAVPAFTSTASSRWARIWLTWAVCGWRGRRGLTRPRQRTST